MKPLVRILIVTDDGLANGGFLQWRDQSMPAAVGVNSREFHLGEFVRVLKDTNWIGFNIEITKAHRSLPGSGGLNEAQLKADRGADVVGFRFNQPFTVSGQSRTLVDYDMVLFFPTKPSDPDVTLASEVEAIAQFMESGRGFFATGDHENLGGELCGLIPRVRSMRRWWLSTGPNGEPAAPPALGSHRHDTTRPGADNIGQFEDQSDEIAQQITPALYGAGLTVRQGYPAFRYLPHPLLCSPDGVVSFLPDHMHEGTCEVPGNLATRTFKIGAATLREYPDYTPSNPPSGYVPVPLAPEVVATSQILPGITTPALDPDAHTGGADPAIGVTFGAIAAWDGQRVGKGRVVVDATWHHFFNINLTGDRYLEDDNLPPQHQQKLHGFYVPDGMGGREPNDQYSMIMWYYRNIVYWLIPADRYQPIWWQSLVDIAKLPKLAEELHVANAKQAFDALRFEHYLYFGQLAEAYLSQARGACSTFIIHPYLYKPKIPWWEWIQEFVDIWDPVQKERVDKEIGGERLVGALGAGPRPELAARLALGAALVTASAARPVLAEGADSPRAMAAVQKLWTGVLNHAVGEFGKRLAIGANVQRKLEKLVAEQTKTAGGGE